MRDYTLESALSSAADAFAALRGTPRRVSRGRSGVPGDWLERRAFRLFLRSPAAARNVAELLESEMHVALLEGLTVRTPSAPFALVLAAAVATGLDQFEGVVLLP